MKKCVYVGFVHLIPIGNEKWVAGYNIIYHSPHPSPPPLFRSHHRSKNYGRKYFCLFIVGAKGNFLFSIHDFESLSSGQLAAIDTIDRLFASKIRIQQSAF